MKRRTVSSLLILSAIVSMLVVAGGCGPSQEEYDEQVRLVTSLRSQLEDASQRQQQMQGELDRLTTENGSLNERLSAMGQLASDLEEARRVAAEYQRRAQQQQERLAAFRNMLSQFRAMIDSGRLRVRIVRGRMVIEMPSNILFETGNADLSDQGEETLAEVAAVLRTIPNRNFQVAGHTDNIPIRTRRFRSNWDLSTARAVRVVKFMIKNGMDKKRISAAGYAETDPVGDNSTEEGRQLNRRIEITLMPSLAELPKIPGA